MVWLLAIADENLKVAAATNGSETWNTISDTCAQNKVIEMATLLSNKHSPMKD